MDWIITAKVDEDGIVKKLENLIDENVMLEIHTLFAKLINEYVPAKSGKMANAEITPEYIRYPGPYAHYQYMGEVYGPNIPIIQNGQVVGWRSIAPKHPTGRKLGTEGELYDEKGNVIWKFGYTKDMHPQIGRAHV